MARIKLGQYVCSLKKVSVKHKSNKGEYEFVTTYAILQPNIYDKPAALALAWDRAYRSPLPWQ